MKYYYFLYCRFPSYVIPYYSDFNYGILIILDLLFADDSVFFTQGGKAKRSMEMGDIVNEVMKSFGQQASFKKTEVMLV